MEPFNDASHRAQVLRLRKLANDALAYYALDVEEFSTLLHLENTTFRVETSNDTYVLRINRPNHRTKAQIRSEAMWLAAIRADTNLVVPEPVANRAGDLVTVAGAKGVPEPRFCVLFKWVEGQFYRDRLSPVALHRVGKFTAQLHNHAAEFDPPDDFARPDVEFGSDEEPGEMLRLLQKGFEEGAAIIAPHDLATFTLARHRLQERIDALGQEPAIYGVIHSDLHHGNLLFEGEEVHAIDFDDCGWGHFLYDLAVTQWYLQARPDFEEMCEAHIAGYRTVRDLPDEHVDLLPTFRAARTLLMAVYMAGRADNPKLRDRAPKFVAHCAGVLRDFIAG